MRHISNKAAWLEEVVSSREHTSRINNIIDVKRHLLGWHKILQKPNSKWKDEVFTTAKTPFRLIGPVIDTHVSYVVGAPISISGDREIVEDFNAINKKTNYGESSRARRE
ncbi:MAG: hypothetical protein VB115_14315 [Christensenellaceae bacterium]|nr:hypothetical protein [Christensenellaceae bacterium]